MDEITTDNIQSTTEENGVITFGHTHYEAPRPTHALLLGENFRIQLSGKPMNRFHRFMVKKVLGLTIITL